MRRHAAIAALTVVLALPAGARAEGFFHGVGVYFKDRFHDLLDVVRLRGGVPEDGKAIGVKAKATSLAQAGYVQFRGRMAGMERRAIGVTAERRTEGGLSLLYWSTNETQTKWGSSFLDPDSLWSRIEDRRIVRNLPYWDDGRRRFLSVGAEVATPIVSLDAGLYPEEALDFALGWIGIDIYDDDELFMDGDDLPEATTPRLPDPRQPFAERRAALKAFDDQMKAEQDAMRKARETSARPAPRDRDTTTGLQIAPKPPATKKADGGITQDQADEAVEHIEKH